jgi:glycosyltransferase involved in cell wall biosynthesis
VLRIGVDARELLGDATGVGRYLGELLRRWATRPDAATRRFVLYSPEPIPLPLSRDAVEYRIVGRGRGTLWEQTALRRALGADPPDVFFAPAYTAPLGLRMPLAVTIHDVSFVAHPEWFRFREGMRRRWLTSRAASSAQIVFTDSMFSQREIEHRLGVPASRIRVVPPGLSPRHVDAPRNARRERLVLYVGSIFNRRRLPHLIESFARATADMPDARLAIVGDNRTWPRQDLSAVAARHGISPRVDLLDYVADGELAALYSRAAVFAFLSEYEGFGLTPLEALAAGVPIVVLDTAVAREVYGSAAQYVPPDIAATALALRAHLERPDGAPARVADAERVLSRFSWDRAAEDTLSEIERIARR